MKFRCSTKANCALPIHRWVTMDQAPAGGGLHHRLRGALGPGRPRFRPAVIAETQLAAVHIEEQRLVRLSATHREYLQRWLRWSAMTQLQVPDAAQLRDLAVFAQRAAAWTTARLSACGCAATA